MARKEYPEVLWQLIIPYARNPIPEPLSAPERNSLRQPDLCTLSRVSKACLPLPSRPQLTVDQRFQLLCEPLLYTDIVTDSLPDFLSGVNIPSRRRLYNRVRSLRIEYAPKCKEPTYAGLMRSGSWQSYGQLQEMIVFSEWEQEIDALANCLAWADEPGRVRAVFPRLAKVAVASVYGTEEGPSVWRTLEMRLGMSGARGMKVLGQYRACARRFDMIIRSGIQHVCIRDPRGPLNLNHSIHFGTPPYDITPTIHFGADIQDDPRLDLPYDSPVRWTSDITSAEIWHNISRAMMATIVGASKNRRREMDMARAKGLGKPRPAKVEIYCTTGVHVPVPDELFDQPTVMPPGETKLQPKTVLRLAEQRYLAKGNAEHARNGLRMGSGLADQVEWSASPDTPFCLACNSGPPVQYW